MAPTVSQLVSNTVVGNMRMSIFNVTPDAATITFDTGMGRNLLAAHNSIKSLASFVNSGSTRNIAVLAVNAGALGTAIAGTLAMTGCIANDVYTVVCYAAS